MNRTFRLDGGTKMGSVYKGVGAQILAAIALTVLAGACAQNQPEINRVQPDYIKKADLNGEWYFQETVIQAPYTSAYTFPGFQGSLERGVFEVQEKSLIFYRTYEFVEGTEAFGQSADVDTPLVDEDGQIVTRTVNVNGVDMQAPVYVYRGAPVASFPILSHFDIRRQYNPTTGEEMNVVDENAERQWWERKYFRVDWVNTGDGLDLRPFTSAADAGNAAVFNGQGADPTEQPVFEYSDVDGDEKLMYFDSVMTGLLGAPTGYLDGFGEIPLCWYYPWYAGQVFECASEQIKVRSSFKRFVQPDYKGQDYDDVEMQKFGYFRADRLKYDELRGVTFSGQSNKISRHNIWENWALDANGKPDYSKMTAKPIVYYLSEKFPRELVTPSIEIAAEWNVSFSDTVKALKGSAPDHDMFILCENSMAEGQAAEAAGHPTAVWNDDGTNPNAKFCLEMDKPKRRGDLRYSLMSAVVEPISYGLYGYGPSNTDPVTGEAISVNAHAYVAAMKQGAERAVATIEMMAGVRDFREIESGVYIEKGQTGKRLRAAGARGGYTSAEVQKIANLVVSPELRQTLATVGLPTDNNFAQSRLDMIKNMPEVEQLMVGDDVKSLFRIPMQSQGGEIAGDELEKVALRNWASVQGHQKQVRYQRDHAAQNIYLEGFADSAIMGLVREYGAMYDQEFCTEFKGQFPGILDWSSFNKVQGKCEKVGAVNAEGWACKTLSKELNASGETSGSYWVNSCSVKKLLDQMRLKVEDIEATNPNAANRPTSPLYWNTEQPELAAMVKAFRMKLDSLRGQIRTELWQRIYKGVQLHEIGHTLGLRHNFEASTDALNFPKSFWDLKMMRGDDGHLHPVNLWQMDTDEQAFGNLRQKQSATVMDYTAKFNGRFDGLGHYDRAAIMYGYGNVVEVFKKGPDKDMLKPYMLEPDATQPGNQTVNVPSGDPIEDAFKKVHFTNYPKFFGDSITAMFDREVMTAEAAKAAGRVEVPYRFCSDELSGRTPTCQVFDEGVDTFEIVRNSAESYENYWPFSGYSHDQVTWWPESYYNGVQRYFGEMRRQFQYWVQGMVHYNQNDWWAKNVGNGVPWDQDINGGLSATVAAYEAFNTMANAFGRPEEGRYGQNQTSNKYEPLFNLDNSQYINQAWVLQESGARPMYASFNFEGYLYTPWRSGAIYDRLAAFVNLADPTVSSFPWVETGQDSQRFRVSYYTVFPKQMMRVMGGLMTSQESTFGWWVCTNEQGKVSSVARRDYFQDVPPANCPTALNPESKSTFPNARYRIPMLAAYYGMSLMVNNLDLSFMDTARLCLKGGGDCVSFAPGTDVVEFEDPLSGKVYQAARVGDSSDFDAAYELVKDAKAAFQSYVNPQTGQINLELLQNEYYFSNLQFLIGRLELVRGMHHTYSYGGQ